MRKISIILFTTLCLLGLHSCGQQRNLDIEEKDKYDIPDSVYSFFPGTSEKFKNMKLGIVYTNAEKMDDNIPFLKRNFSVTKLIRVYKYEDDQTYNLLRKQYVEN